MNPIQAIGTCLRKYVVFSGRARRSEYWWFNLLFAVVYLVALIIDVATKTSVVALLVIAAFVLPLLAAGVRRLHDTGRNGWNILINLIPFVGSIILLVFQCQDSDFDNEYGPNPKAFDTYPNQQLGGGYPQPSGAQQWTPPPTQ